MNQTSKKSWWDRLYVYFDQRMDIGRFLREPMPEGINWLYTLGGLTFILFCMQVVTGILLALYYRPSPETAYESVRRINSQVSFGWMIRGMHHWGANAMILVMMLHMVRVFFCGAYKPPRELNWITGVFLLFITLGFGFTGYLLPWDQVSYWATTVGTEVAGAIPLIGKWLLPLIRGGPEVSGETLTRFFAAHIIILPLAATLVLVIHFFLERYHHLTPPPWIENEKAGAEQGEPFYPNHVVRELMEFFLVFGVILILIAFFPPDLRPKPDPTTTPEHIKPEWYFLAMYQFLKLFPEKMPVLSQIPVLKDILGEGRAFSILLQAFAALLLLLLPFIDRNPEKHPRKRPWATGIAALVIVATVALTIRGFYP